MRYDERWRQKLAQRWEGPGAGPPGATDRWPPSPAGPAAAVRRGHGPRRSSSSRRQRATEAGDAVTRTTDRPTHPGPGQGKGRKDVACACAVQRRPTKACHVTELRRRAAGRRHGCPVRYIHSGFIRRGRRTCVCQCVRACVSSPARPASIIEQWRRRIGRGAIDWLAATATRLRYTTRSVTRTGD